MIENAKNTPIEKLLGKDDNSNELIYKIPPYQREYSWTKEQWENLFDDIEDNNKGYFLGSIICIHESKDSSTFLSVIDGQQRLTTVSILLASLLNVINEYDNNHPTQDIINPRTNKTNGQMYYGLQDMLVIEHNMRLTLSIQNQNTDDYTYLLSINELTKGYEQPKNFGNRRISKAYEYFKNRLLEVDENENHVYSIEKIFEFLKKVSSAMIVKIDVQDIASAFTLFESINNRGMPLTPIDLIKNSIIGKIDKNPEETNQQWQTIVKNIESYEDQVRYLRHYYHAFQNKPEVKNSKFTKATKSNIIKIYSEHIKKNVNFIFTELIEKSKIYTLFVHPENIEENSRFFKYKNKLINLQRLGVAPSYALLLHLFSVNEDEDYTRLLNFLENWFIRRHLTDYPATNKLDQIFLDLISEMEKRDYNLEFIRSFMMVKERYTSDSVFEELLKNGDLYTINVGATRCLLTKLEKSKRTRENEVDFWALSDNKKLIWSIEHILPQNPDKDSNWNDFFNDDERKNYVHKLGNLTLTCYNSTLSNKSFDKKITVQDKEGKDIGLQSGNVLLNEYLKNMKNSQWTKECIETRSSALANNIIKLFKQELEVLT